MGEEYYGMIVANILSMDILDCILRAMVMCAVQIG